MNNQKVIKFSIFVIILLFSFIFSLKSSISSDFPESYYQNKFCTDGRPYQFSNRTFCDCLTDEYAIEYDFSYKWYEAIGQSLYYSLQTDKEKKPGIVLILEKPEDIVYFIRMNDVIKEFNLPIKTWAILNGVLLD